VFRIRIQTGQTPKKAKIKKFHGERVPCWAGGFFWSLKVLLRVQEDKSFVIKKPGSWIQIRVQQNAWIQIWIK
jgi:hypothetical protein